MSDKPIWLGAFRWPADMDPDAALRAEIAANEPRCEATEVLSPAWTSTCLLERGHEGRHLWAVPP